MNELDRYSPAACLGAGRAATTMLHHLARSGLRIGAIWNRTSASTERAIGIIGAGSAASASAELAAHPLLILGVQDQDLARIAAAIATDLPHTDRFQGVALHLSGALAADAVAPLRTRGYALGSFHPMQAFADPTRALRPLAGITIGIEGDGAAVDCMHSLARALQAHTLTLGAADKPLYHACAALASHGLIAVASLAIDGLGLLAAGNQAGRAIAPLLQGTLENLATLGPEQALTGPIARADLTTVASHLRTLSARAPALLPSYRSIARAAIDLGQRSGRLAPERAAALRDLLARVEPPCP